MSLRYYRRCQSLRLYCVGDRVNVNHWWKDTDMEKSKYWAKTRSQCHCVYQKPHLDWPGIGPVSPRWGIGEWQPTSWHGPYWTFQSIF